MITVTYNNGDQSTFYVGTKIPTLLAWQAKNVQADGDELDHIKVGSSVLHAISAAGKDRVVNFNGINAIRAALCFSDDNINIMNTFV